MRVAGVLLLLATAFSGRSEEVETLRAQGQAAVDRLHAEGANDALLDRVCAQRDCRASRLYWHTDLDEARAAAQREGKKVISLHLLGRLDEELSCANSRFFRVMLYSDPRIARLLRERFVLHWRSVRPVPIVTIDIGNGRTIRQTITGNSVHYLLDADGVVLDILPGLHSPGAFHDHVSRWIGLDGRNARKDHSEQLSKIDRQWKILGLEAIVASRPRVISAEEARRRAMSKGIVENPVLSALSLGASLRVMQPEEWQRIAGRMVDEVHFAPESLALMATKQALTDELLEEFRRTVSIDGVFNELELHRRIHLWFIRGEVGDLEAIDRRVYAELFLTPHDDPWMGLKPDGVFTALNE
jgi:hypothetical protein